MKHSINIPAGKFAGEDDVESIDNRRALNGIKVPLCDLVETDSGAEEVAEIQYETEKEEKVCEDKAQRDVAARKREEFRKRLKNSSKVNLDDINHRGFTNASMEKEVSSVFSLGEIERMERVIRKLGIKCKSYFNLLSEEDLHLSPEIASAFIKTINSDNTENPKVDENLSLDPRVHPTIILDQFNKIVSVRNKQDFRIFHFPLPGGGCYAFSTDKLEFPFTAESLILFYFLKKATSFFLPLIWHSGYQKRFLILSYDDITQLTYLTLAKRKVDFEKLKKLPVGLEISDTNSEKTFRFNYYYWNDWTGYVRCKVLITANSNSNLLNESDISLEESITVLYDYNCFIAY